MTWFRFLALPAVCAGFLAVASVAGAQTPPPVPDDPDRDFQALQPDFTVIGLPTGLRVPRHKSAFRVTHRFTRPLADGTVGDLFEDFLSLDSAAQIGLEYRYGVFRGAQLGFRRTNDRTIEFFTELSLAQQRSGSPLSLSVFAAMDGTNNFRDSYTPAVGLVISRTAGRAAFYIEPFWVNNVNPLPSELVDDNDVVVLGLGTRLRIRRTVYLLAEIAPRVAGDDPGVHHASFAIEKVAGGHSFQLNFSNGFGTTMNQIARGAASHDDWYMGFNISRKFF